MADLRISVSPIKADTSGVTMLGYLSGGEPVGIQPQTLWPTLTQLGGVTLSTVNAAVAPKQDVSARGQANGYAPLDGTGKVPASNLPAASSGGANVTNSVAPSALGNTALVGASTDAARADHVHALPTLASLGAAAVSHTHAITAVTGLQLALDGKQSASERGQVNGYAPLGTDGKVPAANLPATISQAQLDAKADAAGTTAALNTKADAAATQATLDSKASISDTRIVNAIQPGYLAAIETFTAAYSAIQADANKIKRSTSASNINVTLPSLSVGTTIRFLQSGTGVLTFVAGTSQTLTSFGGLVATGGPSANVIATVIAANVWNISGNLV